MSSPLISAEVWRAVPTFEGFYEISSEGRVRSIKREPRVLRPFVRVNASTPYAAIYLRAPQRKPVCWLVHAIVLRAFKGERPDGCVGRHLDGDSLNNRRSNLRWGTPLENSDDQRQHGTTPAGERNPKAKLTWRRVREIRVSSESSVALAQRFGVTYFAINDVRRGATWRE